MPAPGTYSFHLWLRDEAGNDSPPTAVEVPLRFDDVPPGVAFAADTGTGFPDSVSADVFDEHSGPAGGEIRYRRLGAENWTDLQARFARDEHPDRAQLVARLPESLPPGTYLFQAEATDAAGNSADATRRADGTEMTLRKAPPPQPERAVSGAKAEKTPIARAKTRIFARLRWRGRLGTSVTVPFGAASVLSGRLLDAGGAGLAGRPIRVVARPSRGAVAPARVETVRTGEHGGFRLDLPSGPSRRITVVFRGEERLERSRRAPLSLRVRSGVVLHAAPRVASHRPGDPPLGPGPGRGSADPASRQARRDPVPGGGDRALAPGPRHPQRPQRPFQGAVPVPLHQRLGPDPPARGRALRGALALRAGRLAPADRPGQRLSARDAAGEDR